MKKNARHILISLTLSVMVGCASQPQAPQSSAPASRATDIQFNKPTSDATPRTPQLPKKTLRPRKVERRNSVKVVALPIETKKAGTLPTVKPEVKKSAPVLAGFLSFPSVTATARRKVAAKDSFDALDVNHDGQVTEQDWKTVLSYLIQQGPGKVSGKLSAIDANKDGVVSIDDVLVIKNRLKPSALAAFLK